jgi:hypothetical protein
LLVYKYFSLERSFFLKELFVRFTPPGLFNDPFDSLPSYEGYNTKFIQEQVNKVGLDLALSIALENTSEFERQIKLALIKPANEILIKEYSADPSKLDTVFQELHRKKLNTDIGMLCLSGNPRSILMWSHYSDEHEGFVIGFDSEDKFFSHSSDEPEDIGLLRPVEYVKDRPRVNIPKITVQKSTPDIFFTKNREWSYEQEWRIIRFFKNADEIRPPNSHLFKVPPTAIREVIFGCKTPPDVVDAISAPLKENSSLSHVKLFCASLSRRLYEMDISPYVARQTSI